MRSLKVVVERCEDGYIAYPLGLKGVIVGEGDTYDEALADVRSAIRFHIETFGSSALDVDPPVLPRDLPTQRELQEVLRLADALLPQVAAGAERKMDAAKDIRTLRER